MHERIQETNAPRNSVKVHTAVTGACDIARLCRHAWHCEGLLSFNTMRNNTSTIIKLVRFRGYSELCMSTAGGAVRVNKSREYICVYGQINKRRRKHDATSICARKCPQMLVHHLKQIQIIFSWIYRYYNASYWLPFRVTCHYPFSHCYLVTYSVAQAVQEHSSRVAWALPDHPSAETASEKLSPGPAINKVNRKLK